MKKIIIIIVAIILTLSCAACDGESGGLFGGGGSNKKGGEIYVCILEAGISDTWMEVMADEYYEETGTKVNWYGDPALDSALKQTMSLGTAEDDLYLAPNTYDWISWMASGMLEDLSDICGDEYDDGTTIESKIKSNVKELGIVNGSRYIVQFTYNPTGIVYNADILKQAGYESFPTTWEELIELCSAINNANLTQKGKKVMPLVWGTNDLFDMFKTLWAQGDYEKFKQYFAQEGSTPNESLFINNERLAALEAIYDLLAPDANYSTTSITGMQGETHLVCEETFVQGYAAMCFSGSWFETEMKSIIDDAGFEYKFATYPSINGNERVVSINYPTEYFMIPSYAKNLDKAKDFLKFMLREENLIKMHGEIQSPLAFDYDTSKVEYTRWGEECQALVESNNQKVVAGAKTMRYLSGGIRPEFASENPFLLMCNGNGTGKTGIKRENLSSILSANYAKFSQNWESGYLKAKGISDLIDSGL